MCTFSAWTLPLVFSVLTVNVLSQELHLSDALDHVEATAAPKPAPAGGAELANKDFLITTKAPSKKPQKTTKAPVKQKPVPAGGDFILSDALDARNDMESKDKNKGQDGVFSDQDLFDIAEDITNKPGKGGRPSGDSHQVEQNGSMAETGTIAGIVSAVAMALVGAVTSYISYQKKKLCFSIQQSLNSDLVKSENPEAVVATEPQVQQTLLEASKADFLNEENPV